MLAVILAYRLPPEMSYHLDSAVISKCTQHLLTLIAVILSGDIPLASDVPQFQRISLVRSSILIWQNRNSFWPYVKTTNAAI